MTTFKFGLFLFGIPAEPEVIDGGPKFLGLLAGGWPVGDAKFVCPEMKNEHCYDKLIEEGQLPFVK